MEWIHDYQLFLFDFDGLLVNTEEIHFEAYRKMCRGRGFTLPWTFSEYCFVAHYDSEMLKQRLYQVLPDLYAMEPDWTVLYAEKKLAMIELLQNGAVQMMPGAEELLTALARVGIARCVVTHSPLEQIDLIRDMNPVLKTVPNWLTRENYIHPKPHPECYLNAIAKFLPEGGKVIGFEDTPRGLRALMETVAKPVLVSKVPYPELKEFSEKGVILLPSLQSVLE